MTSAPEAQRPSSEVPLPGGDFLLFVTRLSFQGLLALGILENPLTKTHQKNLVQARMVLADLQMLREKTAGNLAQEEASHLDKVIADLSHALARLSAETG